MFLLQFSGDCSFLINHTSLSSRIKTAQVQNASPKFANSLFPRTSRRDVRLAAAPLRVHPPPSRAAAAQQKTLHLRLFKEASTNNPTNETGDFGTAVDMVTVVTRAAQTIPHRRRERRRVVSGSFPGMVFHLHLVYWVRSTADM